nr:hypothetical protein CFP56_11962 [Quercus suber]
MANAAMDHPRSGCIPVTLGCLGSGIGRGCEKRGQKTFHIKIRVCYNSKNYACFGQQVCDETGFAFNIDPQNSIAAGNRATRGYCRPQWGARYAQDYRCSALSDTNLEDIINGGG